MPPTAASSSGRCEGYVAGNQDTRGDSSQGPDQRVLHAKADCSIRMGSIRAAVQFPFEACMDDLKTLIREVPDFPKPGILFYDITTLIKDPCGFRGVIDGLKFHYREAKVDIVLGIEARGFIFAPAWHMLWAPASFRCASPRNCRPNASASLTTWSTGPIAWRCTRTPLAGPPGADSGRPAGHWRYGSGCPRWWKNPAA